MGGKIIYLDWWLFSRLPQTSICPWRYSPKHPKKFLLSQKSENRPKHVDRASWPQWVFKRWGGYGVGDITRQRQGVLTWAITRRLPRLHTKQLLIWQKALGIMTNFQALLPSHPQEPSGGLRHLICRPPQAGSLRKEHASYSIQEQWPLEKVPVGCWAFQIKPGSSRPFRTNYTQPTKLPYFSYFPVPVVSSFSLSRY